MRNKHKRSGAKPKKGSVKQKTVEECNEMVNDDNKPAPEKDGAETLRALRALSRDISDLKTELRKEFNQFK